MKAPGIKTGSRLPKNGSDKLKTALMAKNSTMAQNGSIQLKSECSNGGSSIKGHGTSYFGSTLLPAKDNNSNQYMRHPEALRGSLKPSKAP